ncbi:peptidylprolyl isomerase [Altererythrobacter aurantiacus]|uniref:Peptidylprolyl isomerase n=1 Tax=Parapontixanthobacter aurantiacus TaxID=1463599 RepID=A0A844ZED1_9SPHN|nr:peptidylprolyl isomerase [Parapontixanthobacter aurantiacus]MXO85367.1 peptidylprolyl isomerase [Parapontixanthobacter aurantiacus]
MFQFFRKFFQSKIGLAVTFAFLGLIAFAFASSDVANTGTFGGVAGGDRVAVVGDRKVSTAELSRAASTALDQARRDNPNLTMEEFVAAGGLDQTLNRMLDRYAIAEYARSIGLRAGENLVNSEIVNIPQFRGPSGAFDQNVYRAALQQVGLTDAVFRADLADGLLAQQILQPTTANATIPTGIARQYASLFRERRTGSIAFLPSAAFAPEGEASNAQLQSYYNENRSRYVRPERRIIRYVTFGPDAIAEQAAPTEAEITRYYRENEEEFAAREERSFTQVIASSQAAARSIASAVAGGQSLAQAAQAAGLRTTTVDPSTKAEIEATANEAVAKAYFAAGEGSLTTPARGNLGWYVARVEDISSQSGRTLAQAREDIAATVRQQKTNRLLSDLSAEIENSLADGVSLTDLAEELELEVQTTRPVVADGSIYGTPGERVPDAVAPAVETAFQMVESEPQIAEVTRGEEFLIFEVSRITESATAPFAEIRDRLVRDWRIVQGQRAARAAADRVLARMNGETDLPAAVRSLDTSVPPPEAVSLTREELARLREQRVPPPLALFFSMAQGTQKKLEAENSTGYYVVSLNEIIPGQLEQSDPLVAQAQTQLGQAIEQEYQQQLVTAMRNSQGVEINQAAVEAVRRQLIGEN